MLNLHISSTQWPAQLENYFKTQVSTNVLSVDVVGYISSSIYTSDF